MANSALLPLESLVPVETAASTPASAPLAAVPIGEPVHVVALNLEPEMAAWLRAVGIAEGDRVTVLRRAVFGGPIHVRTGSGGEFALHRGLARKIATSAETSKT